MNEEQWLTRFERAKVFWKQRRGRKNPHIKLTSGKHSGAYFNAQAILESENVVLFHEVCTSLAEQLQVECIEHRISAIVVPKSPAEIFAKYVVSALQNMHVALKNLGLCTVTIRNVGSIKTVPLRNFRYVPPGCTLLFFDDVFSTGSTLRIVTAAVQKTERIMHHSCSVILNRSEFDHHHGVQIASLLHHHMPVWEENTCELCEKGSAAMPFDILMAQES
jgi:orotate phosphoribosyltransferase